jgi:tetratricopeptide (TPR) repeat protein
MNRERWSAGRLVIVGTIVLVSFAWIPWTFDPTQIKGSLLVTGTLGLLLVKCAQLLPASPESRREQLLRLAPRSAAHWAVLGWLGLNWLSLAWAVVPAVTLERVTQLTFLILWAWLVMASLRRQSDLNLLFAAYLLCAVGVSAIALTCFLPRAMHITVWPFSLLATTRVTVWPFGNPDFLAGYLLLPTGFAWALVLDRRTTARNRLAAAFALGLLVVTLWATDSLAGRIALGAVVLLVGLGQLRPELRYRVVELLIGVGGLLGYVAGRAVYELGAEGLQALGTGPAARGFYWKWSLTLIQRHLFVGWGAGGVFPSIMSVSNVDRFQHRILFNELTTHSHSEYLEVATELGLVGLAVFVLLLFLLLIPLGRAWMKQDRKELGAAELGLFAGFLGLSAQACFSVALRFPEVACFYWLAVGLLLAWPRLAAGAGPEGVPRALPREAVSPWARRLALLPVLLGIGWLWYEWAWLPFRSAWDSDQAQRLEHRNMDVEARLAYQRALDGRPAYADRLRVLKALGDLEFRNRAFPDAVAVYREALRLAPDVIDIQVALADASTLSGEVEAGVELYARVASVAPDYPGLRVRWAAASAMLATSEQARGRLDVAVGRWRQAVGLDLAKAEYHLGLVRCLLAAGRQAEAEAAFQEMVVRFGDDPRLREKVEKSRSAEQGPQPAPGAGDGD